MQLKSLLFANDGERLFIDEANTIGLPVDVFAGPMAAGIGQVTPEPPKELRQNDEMLLFVEADSKVPAPIGWTEAGDSLYSVVSLESAAARRLSAFYRRAYGDEIPPTIYAPGEQILAQIYTSRPQEPPE
jgi:hypothetical protein